MSRTYAKRSLHSIVAHDLGSRIVSGKLAPGDVLPTEAALSESLDVSRTALREAIKILSAKGLIESRPKTGTRVKPRTSWNLLDPDVLSWHSPIPIRRFSMACLKPA
jgi:DNA-binding FadR family transcriptional regulator